MFALIFLISLQSVVHGADLICSARATAYTVRTGDTLNLIATSCAVTLASLEQNNPQITDPSKIDVGQQVCIPSGCPLATASSSPTTSTEPTATSTPTATITGGASPASPTLFPGSAVSCTGNVAAYTVKSGDTLSAIATSCGISLISLESNNTQLIDPSSIAAGSQICIPTGCKPTTGQAAAPESSSGSSTGHAAHAAYVVIAAVLGPTIPTVAWLIVTYSYRKTKLMIIREVGRHVTEADLGPATPEDPSGWGHRSMPHVLSSARHSGDPLLTVNPLSAQYPVSAHHTAEAAPSGMQKVARHIAVRSLRRWDGILGFRAGSDGLGNAQGVWRDKFEGVRFAVLLLAMRKLNEELQLRSEAHAPGGLLTIWQSSSWTQRNDFVNQLAQLMQNISKAEAQDLPFKDPDVAGMHDKLYRLSSKICCCRQSRPH